MTILLIEDEPLVAKNLVRLVQLLEPGAVVLGPLGSISDVLTFMRSHPQPDLVVSDIQLSDGVSFDIFRQAELHCPVIFTTAYDEYAIRAFKLNSIDYLLKPIDPDELKAAFTKYHQWRGTSAAPDFREQLRDLLLDFTEQGPGKKYKRRFTGHYLRQIVPVPQEQVACFTRDEVIYLYTADGHKLITDYSTLDELEALTDPAVFFRANRQFLLHLDAIAGYQSHYSGKLLVMLKKPNDVEVTISKEKAPMFREWFEQG
ncbi:LytTR family DNA-binding domain-containing protein [Nibrella saemangeumensis]|uniref:LytTR family DNA-binding domain-containing protein n=1 Tax=Nibrella saemangeumensis TaxID=1084526 RepID=A0ABP8MHT0_9BACT